MHGHRLNSDGAVIVGGGLAGQRCLETLRRHGFDGPVRMVCAERHLPYDRPPLSKDLLADQREEQSLSYRPGDWYREQSVDLLRGVRATGLDPGAHRVDLSDGTSLVYRWLLIATGSRPRTLPALQGYENVSTLRTLDDSLRLRDVLSRRSRLAVVGAGFIGQEVAATARGLGVEVTMIEAAPSPLLGILGRELGEWFTGFHRSEGVQVLTDCTVEHVVANGSIQALKLSNGQTIEADHVVVGVGVRPDVDWLAGSGLETDAGVLADQDGRTAADGVLCAGDAAATFDPLAGRHVPGSHWEAAGRQGGRSALVMLGLDPGTAPLTSFWTDQYGIRIQYIGHARLADAVEIEGDVEARSFTATFLRTGSAVAGLTVDRPRALPALRNLIEKGSPCPT